MLEHPVPSDQVLIRGKQMATLRIPISNPKINNQALCVPPSLSKKIQEVYNGHITGMSSLS